MLEVNLISDYLIENNYVSSHDDALGLIVCMSDSWMSSILEDLCEESESVYDYIMEMRKEDKVAGRKKTPLYVPGRKKLMKDTETGKWVKHQKFGEDPFVAAARERQGMGLPRPKPLHPERNFRHAHGGAGGTIRGEAGHLRGVKKKKGAPTPPPEDTASDFYGRQLKAAKAARAMSPRDRYSYYQRTEPVVRKVPKLNLPKPKTSKREELLARMAAAAKKHGIKDD